MAYSQVTLATLQSELSEKFESLAFWTSTESTNALNEALRRFNMLTGMWKQKVALSTAQVNGIPTVWYSLPGTLVYNMRIEYNSYPMDSTTIFDLDYGKPNWEGQTTKTAGAPPRPSLWAPAGLTMIAIWPADASPPNSLTIDGVARTPVLVNPTDFVDLGQDEHLALLSEALHVLLFKGPKEWLAASQAHHQAFLRAAADKNDRLKASTWYRRVMGLDLMRYQKPLRIVPPPQPAQPQEGA